MAPNKQNIMQGKKIAHLEGSVITDTNVASFQEGRKKKRKMLRRQVCFGVVAKALRMPPTIPHTLA